MSYLLHLLVDKIEYDFCEDDEDVQGNWKISRSDDRVTIEYLPFPDSPYPASSNVYRIDRIS